jgi:hypothetical protein
MLYRFHRGIGEAAMRLPAIVLAFVIASPSFAADTAKLLKRTDRGDDDARIEALDDLVDADPALAVDKAVQWLTQERSVRLRREAGRQLWNLEAKAAPAEGALRTALGDDDDWVAYNAVGALAKLDIPDADLRATRLGLARSPDPFIAFYSVRALYPDPELALPQVLDAIFDVVEMAAAGKPEDFSTRNDLSDNARKLLREVAEKNGRAGFDALMAAYDDGSPPIKDIAAYMIDSVPVESGDVQRIATMLESDDLGIVGSALGAMADYREKNTPVLARVLEGLEPDNPPKLRKQTASTLGRMADPPGGFTAQKASSPWRGVVESRIAPALARSATGDADVEVRKEAADALQSLQTWAGPALPLVGSRVENEPDATVRHALVRACWSARETSGLPRAVIERLAANDPDQYVRNEAKSILEALAQMRR